MYDELELDLVGDRKTALFFIISDTDATFNFLVSMAYTQLFNLLCERADDKFGGRLPVHVRCLIDEAANIGQIPNLEKLMATIRSREISACLVLQAQSQLKALYKDNMDTIIGNCDSSLFLGGKEETTLKSWNSLLGKETIDMYNTNVTIGDCIKIDGFRICSGENGLYVNMPSTQDKQGKWRDVCWPVTADFRRQLGDALIEGYGQAIENLQATLEATRGAEKPSLTGALKENAGKVKTQPAKPAPAKSEQAR